MTSTPGTAETGIPDPVGGGESAPRVVVIGGGMSGLLAALRHARSGARVTVLEAEDRVGGAVAAAEVAGLPVNVGAEAFSVASGAVHELLEELGLAAQEVRPAAGRGSRLVSDAGSLPSPPGGLLGIPSRPLAPEVRRVLGTAGAVRAWAERLLPAGYGLRDGVSIGAYVRARMGRRVLERLVAPVVGGVHSSDPMTLELTAIQPRLPAAVRETGSLAAAVSRLRPARTSAGTAVCSLTPTMAELPAALAAEIAARGGCLRTGVTAVGLHREDGTWRLTLDDGSLHRLDGDPHAAGVDVRADHLVIATSPRTAARLLEDAAPRIAAAIPAAPASPVRLVVLVVDAPALDAAPSGTGALVAPGTRAVRAKALTHASAKWDHVREAARGAGEHGHVLRLSYGRPGEEIPPADASLVRLALTDASRILGVALTERDLRGSRIVTWPDAMSQALPGHRDALDRLAELLGADDQGRGLELVGSWRDGTGLAALAAAERERRAAPKAPATSPTTEGTPT